MQKGVATTSATSLTIPGTATYCVVQPQVAAVNYESDGTNPTTGASGGLQLNLGTVLSVSASVGGTIKFINQTASSGALITYECYK